MTTPRVVALALALAGLPLAAAGAELGFVYVESNVGGASGGHFALRLGDRVYAHHADPSGLLLIERRPWDRFVAHYSRFENRPLHVAYVDVSDAELARARDGYDAAWLRERRALAGLSERREDVALLETLLGERTGWDAPGAGLLDPVRSGENPALRERVNAELGGGFLRRRIARLEAALRAGRVDTPNTTRHRERMTEHAALVALNEAQGLASDASVGLTGLGPEERASLVALREQLASETIELLESGRPDKGPALFLAAARHAAVTRSLETQTLVLLDPHLVRDPPLLNAREVNERKEELRVIAGTIAANLRSLRTRALDGSTPTAREVQRLEESAARSLELLRALELGGPVRALVERRTPRRARALVPFRTSTSPASLQAALDAARERVRTLVRALHASHGYDLLRRNCATAAIATLNAALGGAAETRRTLGAALEPGARFGFIPAALFSQVRSQLDPMRVERIPSYRLARLAELRGERGLWLARESTTLWSTIYRPRHADTSFLLFTDDAFWARPFFGAVNLGYGLATSAVGIATAPFDGGRRLERGLLGAIFSVPELAGFNVRKGTFDAATLEPGKP